MGRAIITEQIREGLYKIRMLYNMEPLEAELAGIAKAEADYPQAAVAAYTTLNALQEGREAARAALSELVENWRNDLISEAEPTPRDWPDSPVPDETPAEAQAALLFAAVNDVRGALSLDDLTRDDALDAAAYYALEWLANNDAVSDTYGADKRAADAGYASNSAVGVVEMLAFACADAEEAVGSWARRRNSDLASEDFTECGCAALYRPGSTYGYHYALFLSAPGSTTSVAYPDKDVAKEAASYDSDTLSKIEIPYTDKGEPVTLSDAVAAFANAASSYNAARKEVERINLEHYQREDRGRKLELLQQQVQNDVWAWCVVYKEDLQVGSEVATAEVPGWLGAGADATTTFGVRGPPPEEEYAYTERPINILPASLLTDDGKLRFAETLSDSMVFYNAAMEPGWLKWMPAYRYATITSKADDALIFDLLLDDTKARAPRDNNDQLAIDDDSTVIDVPFHVLGAADGTELLDVNMDVLVGYGSQDRALPKVLGWRREPLKFWQYYNGLFSVENYFTYNVVYTTGLVDYSTKSYQFARKPEQLLSYTYSDWEESTNFTSQYSTQAGDGYTVYPHSQVTKKAGWFTGEMRKVVQVLAGISGAISFSYNWQKTHGIFINSIDGSRWVIEVSADGVYTWELLRKLLSSPDDDGNPLLTSLGYLPFPPGDLSFTEKIQLLSASAMADAYSGEPLTGEIGWGFNADGSECQNVVFGTYDAISGYQKARRYKITIASDNGAGNPNGATISLIDDEYAYSNRIQNYVRAPALTDCGPASVRRLFYNPAGHPTSGELIFPVYVFYKGNNEQVISYRYIPDSVTSESAKKPYSSYSHQECAANPGFPIDSGDIGIWTDGGTVTKGGAIIEGIAAYTNTSPNIEIHTASNFISSIRSTLSGGAIAEAFSSNVPAVYTHFDVFTKTFVYNGTYSELEYWALVIPHFNREAYYFQTKKTANWTNAQKGKATLLAMSGMRDDPPVGSYFNLGGGLVTAGEPIPCGSSQMVPVSNYAYTGGSLILHLDNRQYVCPGGPTVAGTKTWNVTSSVAPSAYNTCTALSPTPQTSGFTLEESYRFVYFNLPDAGDEREVTLETDADILFANTLDDDFGDCPSASSPLWVGNWLDCFTGNGWISPSVKSETQEFDKYIIGSSLLVNLYDVDGLPSGTYQSGWFGVPFP